MNWVDPNGENAIAILGASTVLAVGATLYLQEHPEVADKIWQAWNENTEDEEMCPIPDSPSDSPGEDWEWKGSGPPESGKGNWVNDKTGQKLHPDLNHLPPKGPHWGLTNPDGSKWDYFPGTAIPG